MLQNINNLEHTNNLNLTDQNIHTVLTASFDNLLSDNELTDNELTDNELTDKETQCMICYEDVDEINWIVFECKHQMCVECLQKLYKYRGKKTITCPFCRFVIEKSIRNDEPIREPFYTRFYLNLSRNPVFCFIFNLMSFVICIGLLIIIPNHAENVSNNMHRNNQISK
tara:strand:+ start:69 stop:575 length:507 start_codon:yes stop_codon:yes gene_type:complete